MIQFKIKLCMEFLLTISLALFANYDVFARPNFSENYCGDDPIKNKNKNKNKKNTQKTYKYRKSSIKPPGRLISFKHF